MRELDHIRQPGYIQAWKQIRINATKPEPLTWIQRVQTKLNTPITARSWLRTFRAHPYEVITWDILQGLVGRNFQQRISEARRQLKMNIENVPQFSADGKRLTGAYRFRPEALGRDGADLTKAKEQDLFTDLAEWQR
jgi:hypothetical protein